MDPRIIYGIEKMLVNGNWGGAAILLGMGLVGTAVKEVLKKQTNKSND